MKLKKGDIVGRLSYNKDIAFVISNIIKYKNQEIAILKGIVTRIEADSPLDDLELIESDKVIKLLGNFDEDIEIRKKKLLGIFDSGLKRNREHYGKILHLDRRQKIQWKISKIL